MTKTWIQPKLVMGHLEAVGPDGEEAIPYDEAVIHLEGDEDSEIEVRCPGALRLAPIIVKAVNAHEAMVAALEEAKAALIKIRSYSIAGCEQGYGRPELWADNLFRSHADVAASLKTIDRLIAVVEGVAK